MSRRLALPLAGALLALAIFASDVLRASAHERFVSGQRYEDVYYLPPAEWLRVFSLGYDEALADLIWMRALVYFGDEFRHSGRIEYVFEYANAIATLDPHFLAIYNWVGMAGLYRPVAITPEDIERSVAFMKRGERYFPDDGELQWNIGAALVFELPPLLGSDEEGIRRARERGLPYLMAAVRRGAAPDWAALSNASLLERIGRQEQAARHLEEMYATVEDPETRERIATRIRELRDRAQAEAFLESTRELEDARVRDFPYVRSSMYHLLGARPPVDVIGPVRDGAARALSEP
jgi:hypothetical protein